MANLIPDLKAVICSFLTAPSIAQASAISKSWRDVLHHPLTWRHTDLNRDLIWSNYADVAAWAFKTWQSGACWPDELLGVDAGCPEVFPGFVALIQDQPVANLRTLQLWGIQESENHLLIEALTAVPTLSSLELCQCDLANVVFPVMPSLSSLTLARSRFTLARSRLVAEAAFA